MLKIGLKLPDRHSADRTHLLQAVNVSLKMQAHICIMHIFGKMQRPKNTVYALYNLILSASDGGKA